MTQITHANFASLLKESTNPAGSSPNGNFYFDTANNQIQLIGVDELAMVDFGAGAVTNPLNDFDGITLRALYNFENGRRRVNETLRKFERGSKGTYRFVGAYAFVNGVKPRNADLRKIRTSGCIMYANTGDGQTAIDRIYHGLFSQNAVRGTTVGYYALVTDTAEATLQAATWTSFQRAGDIDELVQVYGSTANGDTGAGNFDYTGRTLVVRIRSWNYFPGEATSVGAKISELNGFAAGYGVGETSNPNNAYTLADVYGGSAIAPWASMAFQKLAAPYTETGFVDGSAAFSWVLDVPTGATAKQAAAYLDAIALQDADVDTGAGSYNGKKGRIWYEYDSAGRIVTSQGLLIRGLSTAEKQNVVQTDDAGDPHTYPFYPQVEIAVGPAALADANAWWHVQYANGAAGADFDTANAVTATDANGNPMKGNVAADAVGGKIIRPYNYDANTEAGLAAGIDKAIVVLVEGDGGAAQARTDATITRSAVVPITCAPLADTNA